jgi:uncharacterized protein YndB with AHSA1/START domain
MTEALREGYPYRWASNPAASIESRPPMGPVSAEVEIDVPRPRIFEALLDLSFRPAFTGHFVSGFHLTRIESSGVGAGARFRYSVRPRAVWTDTTIVEVEEPYRILERGWGGRGNRVPSTTLWELSEGPGSLTQVRVSYWTEPPNPLDRGLELLAASSIPYQRHWREALRRLRDLLEAGQLGESRAAVAGGNRHPTGIA